MAEIGIVTGIEIKVNKDGEQPVRMLQVKVSEESDVQSIEHFRQPGDDTAPIIGSEVVIIELSPSWKIAISNDDNVVPTSAEGEKLLYSIDAGAIAAFIKLLVNKNIEIDGESVQITGSTDIQLNGSADSAVAFTDLKTAFDLLRTELNAFVTSHIAHIHLGTDSLGGPLTILPTVPPAVPATADMSAAEVPTVKLP